jgi:hypothetical protein
LKVFEYVMSYDTLHSPKEYNSLTPPTITDYVRLYKTFLSPSSEMMNADCVPLLVRVYSEEAKIELEKANCVLSRVKELFCEIKDLCSYVLEVILFPNFLQSRYYLRYKARQ